MEDVTSSFPLKELKSIKSLEEDEKDQDRGSSNKNNERECRPNKKTIEHYCCHMRQHIGQNYPKWEGKI